MMKHYIAGLRGEGPLLCGFCHSSEQGTHGEVLKKWSWEWSQFIPVCREHSKNWTTFEDWKKSNGETTAMKNKPNPHAHSGRMVATPK